MCILNNSVAQSESRSIMRKRRENRIHRQPNIPIKNVALLINYTQISVLYNQVLHHIMALHRV